MGNYSRNDWRDYLAHSWGTSPDQKAKEKAYNHEYYEKHKQLLNSSRKKFGDKDTQRADPASLEDFWRYSEGDIEDIASIMDINARLGGYSPEVMANIELHNKYIIENITNLQNQVEKYFKEKGASLSDGERQQVLAQMNKEISAAKDMMLDLRKDSTREYLAQLGATPISNSGSKSAAKKEEVKASPGELRAEAQAPKVSNNKKDLSGWYERGDEQYEEYLKEKNKKK